MGMYTEVYICSELTKDAPIEILKYLFDGGNLPENLPDHKFFECPRWRLIGRGCSYYHIPFPVSVLKFDDISKTYYLVSRSDLKNYDDEIELFFEWIMPYLDVSEGKFVGYSRYEESNQPHLYFKT